MFGEGESFSRFGRTGNKEVCLNHRGINLLSIPGKLFAMILSERIRPTFHNHRRCEQAGFTFGRSTTEQIFAIRQIIEKSKEFNKSTYIAFIDFKAAFDPVSRDSLWKILQICGVPQELSFLVRQLYTYTRSAVRLASSLSEEFTIETSVKQGCVIAPDLFNCVIDHLMRRLLSHCSLGIQLGEYQLTDLAYADDIAIIAPSACVLQEALMILQEEANLLGMQISWPKTNLMTNTPNPTNHLPLKICNKEVPFVDSFTYIGSLITNDGSSSRDITSRIAKAASAMYRLSNPLFRKHRISIQTKINMYRALVVSVLHYGSETWATTLADRRRLDVFDMRCQRRLLRVFWQQHISNHSISERTKQPTASTLLRQRRLCWYGHLRRMSSSLPVRRVYDFNPNIHGWKRPRGRPKTRWADSIKHDLNAAGLDTTNAAQMVFEQPQWNSFVSRLPTLEPEHGS